MFQKVTNQVIKDAVNSVKEEVRQTLDDQMPLIVAALVITFISAVVLKKIRKPSVVVMKHYIYNCGRML